MNRVGILAFVTGVISLSTIVVGAEQETSVELAFMPSAMDVILLNEGGKYVAVDLKKIAQGEKCHIDKDATVMKIGVGATADRVRVRYASPNIAHGGCPFMTEFEMTTTEYTSARAAFTAKSDEATKKVEDLKKQLGDKWNELMAKKS